MEFFLQCLKKQFFHLLLKCHAKLRFLTIAQRKHMYILEPKIAPPYSSLHMTCILRDSTSTPSVLKLHFPCLQVASKREKQAGSITYMRLLKLILNNLVQVDFVKFKARVLKFKLLMFHQLCNILSLKDFSRFSGLWALTHRCIISPLKKDATPLRSSTKLLFYRIALTYLTYSGMVNERTDLLQYSLTYSTQVRLKLTKIYFLYPIVLFNQISK